MLWILMSINAPVPGVHKLEYGYGKEGMKAVTGYTSFYTLEAWSCPFWFGG